jgi:hypothetical protein
MIRPSSLLLTLVIPYVISTSAHADDVPAVIVAKGELGLEGTVQSIDKATGQISILATAFSTVGARKAITPPKNKILATQGSARLFDARTKRNVEISEVEVGSSVRVVGRDGGAGKPLVVRLLNWSSSEPVDPPDLDTPAPLVGLLPPSQIAAGVRMRVFDAGFAPEKTLFSWSKKPQPTFFLSYRIFPPTGVNAGRHWSEYARFVSLTTPDGEIINSSRTDNIRGKVNARALSFPTVNPRWKSVMASWEVTLPNAPANASGEFAGIYTLQGEAPTPEKPVVEPNTLVKTPQGTIYTLQSISCDYENKKTTFKISVATSKDVSKVNLLTIPSSITDDRGTELRANSSQTLTSLVLVSDSLPAAGAKSIDIRLNVNERSESWKKKEFFKLINFEVPVASVVKAKPLDVSTIGALPSYRAQGELLEGRLDEIALEGSEYRATLWTRPRTDSATGTTNERRQAAVSDGKLLDSYGREFHVNTSSTNEVFFHNDGSIMAPDERAYTVRIRFDGKPKGKDRDKEKIPSGPLRLELKTIEWKTILHVVDLPALKIPAKNAPVKPDTSKAAGTLRLRHVAVVQGKSADDVMLRTGGNARADASGSVVLVFNVGRSIPSAALTLKSLRINNGEEMAKNATTSTWAGDALELRDQWNAWSVIFPLPQGIPKTMKVHVELEEIGPQGASTPIVFDGVQVKPAGE